MTARQKKLGGILLTGEEALVVEFTHLCAERGVNATVLKRSSARGGARRGSARCGFELTNTDVDEKKASLRNLENALPPSALIFSSSITVTATEQSAWVRRPERLVGIAALPTLCGGALFELAPTITTTSETMRDAAGTCALLGKEVSVVQDRIGMVLPRIVCMLVNEAAFALMEHVASPADIDMAMKLGTNYPRGPVSWGDAIGLRQVVAILDALQEESGEERYRVAPLLRQLASGPSWWKT